MARHRETLATTVRGEYRRDLGWLVNREGKLVQPRFLLGYDKALAEIKAHQLEAVWATVERTWQRDRNRALPAEKTRWNEDTIAIARAVAKGQRSVTINPRTGYDTATTENYAAYLHQLRQDFPMVEINFDDADLQERGLAQLQNAQIMAEQTVNFIAPKKASTQRLHAALGGFRRYLQQKYDGNKRFFKKLEDRVTAIKNKQRNVSLDEVDANFLDVWFAAWGARPTKPSGGLYAKNTIRDIVKTLRTFLKWLHRDKSWDWRMPEAWDMPRVKVKVLPEERARKRQIPKYKRAELVTLYESAIPFERVLLLLGLNCGFGKAECETLQLAEIDLEKGTIARERTKTDVFGRWKLWPETIDGLRWYIEHHRPQSDSGYVFIGKTKKPLYEQTKGHNPNQRIPSMWLRLNARIRKDQPDFRKLSFNKLRKTSSSWIRKHFSGETASIFLAHGHVTGDTLLEDYAVRYFARVKRATEAYGRWLRKAWHVDNPFPAETKGVRTVLPLRTINRIKELARQGFVPSKISELTGISETTCKRYARVAEKERLASATTTVTPTTQPPAPIA